jgi:hypothetical protein
MQAPTTDDTRDHGPSRAARGRTLIALSFVGLVAGTGCTAKISTTAPLVQENTGAIGSGGAGAAMGAGSGGTVALGGIGGGTTVGGSSGIGSGGLGSGGTGAGGLGAGGSAASTAGDTGLGGLATNSGSGGLGASGGPSISEPREALPCFADEGTPAGTAIDLQLVPSRVTGVAPLLVFFETEGTTADATDRPFHELAYCWDFGDQDAGTFNATGLSKNAAKGPVSAHVFESPGTHTVTVSARDAMGRVTSRSVEVTAEDPNSVFSGANTVCLSDNGEFAGCPEGAEQVTSTELGELGGSVRQGVRLLLRRGGSFSGNLNINVPGPGMVGAFGAEGDPKPKILGPDAAVFKVSDEEPTFNDWRFVDLDITGTDNTKAVEVNGKSSDVLLLRLQVYGVLALLTAGDSIIDFWNKNGSPGHDVTDVLGVHDCDMRHSINGGNHIYAAAHRMSMQGNYAHDSIEGEHLIRTPWIDRGVFSHNDLGEAPQPRHLLKIHGPRYTDSSSVGFEKYTEKVVISDNLFDGVGGNEWSVALGPQNANSDERLRDIIVERNLFLPGDAAQVALLIWASKVTIRDNLFNRGPQRDCIAGGTRGVEPASDDITLIHNTCYSNISSGPRLAGFDGTTTNLRAFNNLVVGPNADEALTGPIVAEAGNVLAANASFADPALVKWQDFALSAGDPAIDAADPAYPSMWDFSGRPRASDGDGSGSPEADVGALEHSP